MGTRSKKTTDEIIMYIVKIIVAIIMFTPIIWILTGGFKTLTEFTTSSSIIPKKATLENYAYIFKHSPIWKYMFNTIFLMAGTSG